MDTNFKIKFRKEERKQRDDITKSKHYDTRKPEVTYSHQHPLEEGEKAKEIVEEKGGV